MCRTRRLRPRPAGAPEASFSARLCSRLPRASDSLGQSAAWAALAGPIVLPPHRELASGGRVRARRRRRRRWSGPGLGIGLGLRRRRRWSAPGYSRVKVRVGYSRVKVRVGVRVGAGVGLRAVERAHPRRVDRRQHQAAQDRLDQVGDVKALALGGA